MLEEPCGQAHVCSLTCPVPQDVGMAQGSPQAAEQRALWGEEQRKAAKAAANIITFSVLRPGTRPA